MKRIEQFNWKHIWQVTYPVNPMKDVDYDAIAVTAKDYRKHYSSLYRIKFLTDSIRKPCDIQNPKWTDPNNCSASLIMFINWNKEEVYYIGTSLSNVSKLLKDFDIVLDKL